MTFSTWTMFLALKLTLKFTVANLSSMQKYAVDNFRLDINVNSHHLVFQANLLRIRLIDSGEIIDMEENRLKKLPHDIKSLPACAFLCKIDKVLNKKQSNR